MRRDVVTTPSLPVEIQICILYFKSPSGRLGRSVKLPKIKNAFKFVLPKMGSSSSTVLEVVAEQQQRPFNLLPITIIIILL